MKFIDLDLHGEKLNIGVVGDVMIDAYYEVKVDRISPEFPIPVYHSDNTFHRIFPGGASNVARQFSNFNFNTNLFCFADNESHCLRAFIVDVPLIPRKQRIYSNNVPLVRWDIESERYGLSKEQLRENVSRLFCSYFDFIETLDLVILSDYGKGLFYFNDLTQDLIKKCKISIVDPKDGNLDKWKGCTIFKPNLKEALSLSGKNTVEEAGNYLLGYLGCQAVVITESENGVSVFDASGFTKISPDKKSIKVESVCGAGDCYTAFLGMALCRGLNIQEAAQVAWEAGKRYVQNKYNKPLFPIDFSSGIVDDPEILSKRDFNLVVANGCFDLGLTEAHVKLFEFAKSQGNKLCVCVNSDESMARIKRKAILPLKERMAIVAANKFVDYVVSFEENTPLELFRKIKPNLIVKGGDYKPEDVAGYGLFPVKIFPLVSSMSTTEKIKAAAKNGYWMLIDRLFHGP